MPTIALQLPNPCKPNSGMPSDKLVNMDLIGHHYFVGKSPVFNMDQNGFVTAKKEGEAPAPAGAPKGGNGQGDGAVAWLYLTDDGSEGASWKQIYRVDTAGGSPPDTCEGVTGNFEVEYAAQYWFYD